MLPKSFSRPRLLYSTNSPLSGAIKVWQQGKERTLTVENYPQSVNLDAYDLENRFWGKIVGETAKRMSDLKTVLMLGVGGVTVAHLLAQGFPGVLIDGVEIDPVIVEVGKRFFELDKIPNLKIIVADAADVCRNPEHYDLSASRYTLIVFDLYFGDEAPQGVWEKETLLGVSKLLAPKGMAVFNVVVRANLEELRAKLRRVFNDIEEVGVQYGWGLPPGNILFFCS